MEPDVLIQETFREHVEGNMKKILREHEGTWACE
jgi:hypothetical protein